jgi:hypothetical protein
MQWRSHRGDGDNSDTQLEYQVSLLMSGVGTTHFRNAD